MASTVQAASPTVYVPPASVEPAKQAKKEKEKKAKKDAEEAAKKAAKDAKNAADAAKIAAPKAVEALAPVTYNAVDPNTPAGAASLAQSAGAAQNMAAYDAYTRNALGASPEESMRNAQAAAAQGAQGVSDQAIQQSIKAGRTGGMMGGAAALAATGQAAGAYGQALQAGQQQYFNTAQLGGQLGAEMSGRLQRTAEDATQRYGVQVGANTQRYGTDVGAAQQRYGTDVGAAQQQYSTDVNADTQAKQIAAQKKMAKDQNKNSTRGQDIGLLGQGIGALAGVGGAIAASDKNLKEDIQPKSMTGGLNKMQSFAYKYKPGVAYEGGRQEGGVMAQDLEKTAMKSAVLDTPDGKMIDTRKLSTMNTGALSEHEKRLQQIEKLVKSLGEIPAPKGKK